MLRYSSSSLSSDNSQQKYRYNVAPDEIEVELFILLFSFLLLPFAAPQYCGMLIDSARLPQMASCWDIRCSCQVGGGLVRDTSRI